MFLRCSLCILLDYFKVSMLLFSQVISTGLSMRITPWAFRLFKTRFNCLIWATQVGASAKDKPTLYVFLKPLTTSTTATASIVGSLLAFISVVDDPIKQPIPIKNKTLLKWFVFLTGDEFMFCIFLAFFLRGLVTDLVLYTNVSKHNWGNSWLLVNDRFGYK